MLEVWEMILLFRVTGGIVLCLRLKDDVRGLFIVDFYSPFGVPWFYHIKVGL